MVTRRYFNLAVALDGEVGDDGRPIGRALACSTFHHFADMNWDVHAGAPSFVTDPPGHEIEHDPERFEIFKGYVRNIAELARRHSSTGRGVLMTWYLSNNKVRPVGLEVAEFIDSSDLDGPRPRPGRRRRDRRPDRRSDRRCRSRGGCLSLGVMPVAP